MASSPLNKRELGKKGPQAQRTGQRPTANAANNPPVSARRDGKDFRRAEGLFAGPETGGEPERERPGPSGEGAGGVWGISGLAGGSEIGGNHRFQRDRNRCIKAHPADTTPIPGRQAANRIRE